METKKLIVCRKCGGNHLTIKCGKLPTPIPEITQNKQHFKNNKYKQYEQQSQTPTTIKMSNLPTDFREHEIKNIIYNWGHINRCKVINYDEETVIFIEFGYKEEAEYFVNAFDKTPFSNVLINCSITKTLAQ